MPTQDPDLPRAALPLFAPLSPPMVSHLLVHQGRVLSQERKQHPGKDALYRELSIDQPWQVLDLHMRQARSIAFTYMSAFVSRMRSNQPHVFTTRWFLRTLAWHMPGKQHVPERTLYAWHRRGLFRFTERGLPDPETAAALFIARLVDTLIDEAHPRIRNWLPSSISTRDAAWWCFTQEEPEAEVVPWPVDRLEMLPPATLCWTPWAGASWYPFITQPGGVSSWIPITDTIDIVGAIRFAGQKSIRGRLIWQVGEKDLRRWYPALAELPPGLGRFPALRDDILQTQANEVLLCMAPGRLLS